MNRLWWLKVAAACSTMTILSACGATLNSGAALGRAHAGVTLERQPDQCGEPVPHIALRAGVEARSLLRRERAQLDVANARIADCYAFNDSLRTGLSGPGQPQLGSRQ